jgi:hypothetical protein
VVKDEPRSGRLIEAVLDASPPGHTPSTCKAQMGHSSIRVTLDLYGHLFPDANRGVLTALDDLITPSTPHRKSNPNGAPNEKV